MFEEELELEKKSGGWVPLILVLGLAALLIGGGVMLVRMVLETKRGVDPAVAAEAVGSSLKAQGPAVMHFHTGMVKASVDEKPGDPHYRLLEKIGMVKLKKPRPSDGAVEVTLTPDGQKQLDALAGVQKNTEPDGNVSYTVPLATRRFGEISKVTMDSPSVARVEFTWKWETNKLGDAFDASGPMVKAFNTWDRATLIQKYGAAFYHGEPTRAAVRLVKKDGQWQVASE